MFTVGIIGRPNVGKSCLFNNLLRSRRSIVFDEAGTTRDQIAESVVWEGKKLWLVDSQGIFAEGDASVITAMGRRSDCFLFVVDGFSGPTPFDAWIAGLLRPLKKPVLLIVNKCDLGSTQNPFDFSEIGFSEMVIASATQRSNLAQIRKWCLNQWEGWVERKRTSGFLNDLNLFSPDEPESYPMDRFIEKPPRSKFPDDTLKPNVSGTLTVALVGRPNSGKSTLMNRLCRAEVSLVSPVPLTTRDPLIHELETPQGRVRLIDTAGIRRPRSAKSALEIFSIKAAQTKMQSADVVFLLIASHETITDQDMRLLNLLERSGKPAVILLNFWDKVEKNLRRTYLEDSDFGRVLRHFPIVSISAKTGYQVEQCLPRAFQLFRKTSRRVPTSLLNLLLDKIVKKNPPPLLGKKNFNILYASQVGVEPPTFVLFVNRKEALPSHYCRYIENQLKQSLRLKGQPVKVLFRGREKKDPKGPHKKITSRFRHHISGPSLNGPHS